jgi:ubiquinone biosynthesis protein
VAHPIVEDYITTSIGPRAVMGDLAKTARILARFGPRLPNLVEAALIRQSQDPPAPPRHRPLRALGYVAIGGGATLGAVWLISLL